MAARLRKGRSRYDLTIDSTNARPVYLMFDRTKTRNGKTVPLSFAAKYVPNEPGDAGSIQIQEWTWSNGPGGAGTSIETPSSYEADACEYGNPAWLRRIGVAQAPGRVVEVTLPTATAALTSGRFTAGKRFGNDLWITTGNRYVVKVANATGTGTQTEQDFGVGSISKGIAIFNGAGTSRLYVGDTIGGIQEYNGTTWTEGAAGTERDWLETPYWVLGDQTATGGALGDAGVGAHRLNGSNATGTGFYHVAGDPKVSANWSALTTVGVGGTAFPINKTVANNRVVWFGTGLGVLGADGVGYTPNLTKWVELVSSANTAKAIEFWNDLIWFATEQGLSAFRPDGGRVDFGQFMQFGAKTGTTPIFGRPRALAPSPDGLYVGYYNGTDSYIGCLLFDENGYRWSMAEAVIPNQEVTYLQQVSDSSGHPHLFIGTIDATGHLHLYVQSLPDSGDPETDTLHGASFRAAEQWEIRLSRFNGGRAIPKTFRRYMVEADYLGDDYPGNTVEVQVAADGGTFASQGTATQSPRWTGTPRSEYVRATNAQMKLIAHNSATAPLVIRAAGIRYSPHPELNKVFALPVIFGEAVTGQAPGESLTRLENMQKRGPVTCEDFLGRTVEWIIEPGLNEEYEEESTGKGFTVHATLTVSVVRDSMRFNRGDTFNSGESFS